MKKNLIALAIFGAFSGAALAQSNVTLYGIIDVNYQYNDPDVSGASSTSGINSGHQSGSRWGIRGSEALSPNLNAVFTLEGGFGVDDGTATPRWPVVRPSGLGRFGGRLGHLGRLAESQRFHRAPVPLTCSASSIRSAPVLVIRRWVRRLTPPAHSG